MKQQIYKRGTRGRTANFLLAALFAVLPGSLLAENAEAPAEPDPTEVPVDACDRDPDHHELQEQSREVLRSWSCHSFRWFDSWWGDSKDFPENEVRGWMIAGAEYRQYDGFDPRLRIRVRAPLPNLNERWDIILGRVDETSYVSDTQTDDTQFFNPGAVNQQDQEAEWLLGLGHRGKGSRKGWDWSAGVRLRVPPRPYAKLQYYYNKDFSENTSLLFRQTFFWRSDDGFGLTSRGEVTQEIDPGNHLRYEGIITHSEETLGNEWYFGTTWYHQFAGKNGLSLLAFANGETEAEVPLKEYGFNLIWRRPFTREWMYLSMGPSVTWPREFITEKREMSLGFGVWIEMEFGAEWRY